MEKRKDFLPVSRPYLNGQEILAVTKVLESGWWTTGPVCTEFEQELAAWIGRDGHKVHCVGLNSCTAALHLALAALGVGVGDEVIVPTWTFASSALVVEWLGARPILCDVEGTSLNIDMDKAEALCTARTRAIMPVHIAGWPCNMNAIADLAKRKNLYVIEDAAHAIGTEYAGQRIGTFSDVTCFSFYATKNLAMGEGGAAITQDKDLADKIRKLGYFGINKEAFKRYEKAGNWRYDIEEVGYKNNLDSIHAAIGLVQLRCLDDMLKQRHSLAMRYKERLFDFLQTSFDSPEHIHARHIFPIFLPEGCNRDSIIEELKTWNIGTSVHFMPLHLHSHFANRFTQGSFPTAEALFERAVSLPMWAGMTLEDVDYVCDVLRMMIK